ncbi:MAG TPA: class I SAM-dependent RNA methyltransferase [Pyrinomonadaceae bacterium]|nr:class I SAM-dependent RNA methyltransferase [Pyrinomonadaceae bacterium]
MGFEVEVERILPGGMGLAHAEGKTVFVSLAAPGDRVRVRVEREQGKVLFASIEEILVPSPSRIEPPCPYFGRCGGCDFQQLTYKAQLEAKAEIIRDCLHRIARLESVPEIVVMPSPENWRYRMRATWQIDEELRTVGYYERGSRRVCDVVDCAVLQPELQAKLAEVRATEWYQFPPGMKHLDVVVGESGASFAPEFAEFETRELSLTVKGAVYRYNAEAFFQVNPSLLGPLIDFALADASGESALDLYSGVGLFTLPLARRFKNVVAVEANSTATRFARRNLQDAELANARVITDTVTDWFRNGPTTAVDFVLLDPPRAGAESAVIKGIVDLHPAAISYVSCDPATLARDLKKLIEGGYTLDTIAAFDLFPQTHHVETVVHLSHKKAKKAQK